MIMLLTCFYMLLISMGFLLQESKGTGQFDANFTLQSVFGRLTPNARSSIQCTSSNEAPNKIKIHRFDTGQGTRLPKHSVQYLQMSTRIFLTRPEDGLLRFGAFQCKMSIKGVVTETVALKLPPLTHAELEAEHPYQVANLGDDVHLKIHILKKLDIPIRWRHNNKDLDASWNNQTSRTLIDIKKNDSGIYEAFYLGRRNASVHALMRLIVRGCAAELYGDDCGQVCPPCYNGGICHDKWGVCVCPAGFTGTHCQYACGGNRFGEDCSKYCTPTQNDTTLEDGCALFTFCKPDPYGCSCASGFKGPTCMEHCESGWYGPDCLQPCHCAYGARVCHRITGACDGGCENGWRGGSCEIFDPDATAGPLLETTTMASCVLGKYGPKCEKNCHCSNAQMCDVISGQCPSGCENGWNGSSCSVCEKGRFGENCEFFCHCEGGHNMCDKEGYCFTGCNAGWAGFTCQQECTDGRFGHNCASTCHCFSEVDTCNKVTGECAGDCQPGFMGNNCQTLCSSTSYGVNCKFTCSCFNGGLCNRIDGTCACEGRWRGQVCNESEPQIIAAADEEVNTGQTAFLSCTADAVPPPEMNLASLNFPGFPFNLRALDKNQFQAVMKITSIKSGDFNFSCSAKNSHGFDMKIVIFSVIDPPELVNAPQVIDQTKTSLYVRWDAWKYGYDFGGKPSDSVEYMALYREFGKSDWLQHNSWTQVLDSTITNLMSYTEYEVSVKCRRPNKGGEGSPGPHVTAKTMCGDPLANGIPHHFLPDEMSPNFVRLTWKNPPETLLKCKLIGYNLVYFPDGDNLPGNITLNNLSIDDIRNEIELHDIPPNSLYKYHLYPVTTSGRSKYYAELTFRTTELVPGPVMDLKYEIGDGFDTLLIRWKEPTIRNGLIKAYNVTYELTDNKYCSKKLLERDSVAAFSLITTESKMTLVNLLPFSSYLITVAAQTASGEGDATVLVATTAEAAPDIGPPNLRVMEVSSSSILFEWDPIPCEFANGIIIEYEYNLVASEVLLHKKSRRGADVNIGFTLTKIKGLKVLVSNLHSYVEYGIAVRGYTKVDFGPFCDFVFVRTKEGLPVPPSQFIIDSSSSHHMIVSWLTPQSFFGTIEAYNVRYRPTKNPEHNTDMIFNVSTKTSVDEWVFGNVTKLEGAVSYVLKIQSCSEAGCGNWSNEILGRTLDGVPEPPTELSLIDSSETTLKITWKVPLVTNGIISNYKITFRPVTTLDSAYALPKYGVKESVVNGDVTTVILDLLHTSTQYLVQVQAKTSVGYGPEASLLCWTFIQGDHILPSVHAINIDATNETVPIIFTTEQKSDVFKYQIIVENSHHVDPINEDLLTGYQSAVIKHKLPYYITAELDPNNVSSSGQQSFTVGDRKIWGGYLNVHLNPGHEYQIRVRTLIKIGDEMKSIISEPREQSAVTTVTQIGPHERKRILGLGFLPFILVVISVLVFLFIVSFFTVLVICRRKEKRKPGTALYNRDSGLSESMTWSVMYRASESEASGGPLVCEGWKYTTSIDRSTLKKSKSYAKNCVGIPIEKLADYVYDANTASRLSEEFKQLVSGQTAAWTLARKSENLKKNRYGNILPYDRSRVILHTEATVSDSNYINASFIDGYGRQKEYIVTQGPLECTVIDFWRMVWQENAPVIIMLTDQVENGKKKCSKYWPDDSLTSGNISILNIFVEECADFTIRTLLMRKMDEGRTHRVLQYQFTGWPDRTVPLNSYFLLKMIKRVRADNPVLGGPMIVHCSAGAGRSGTYVALDALIQQAENEKQVDIFRFVNSARLQRINLVQTMEQYLFIHEALLDWVSSKDTTIPLYQIIQHLQELRQSSTLDPKSIIRKQFQMLKHSQKRFDVTCCSIALSESNIFKNRDPMTVPADSSRVYLQGKCDFAGVSDDYINAVYVDTYRKQDAYLVTQMPLHHTVEDFWKLVYQAKSSLIVMLNDTCDDSDENVARYWPNENQSRYGDIEVELVAFEEQNELTIQILKLVKYKETSCVSRQVIQLLCKTWYSSQPVPINACSMLNLLLTVDLWYQRSEGGPIVIHCMDGFTRCGLFCASSYIRDQIEAEKVLDAYQAVKNIRTNRPEFISTLEQFVFCFEVANSFSSAHELHHEMPACKV